MKKYMGTWWLLGAISLLFLTAAGCSQPIGGGATNAAPIADAGVDEAAAPGVTVFLTGTGSTDPDGDPLTYAWTFVSIPTGSAAELTNPNTATPSFTPDVVGSYVVELMVSDGDLSHTDRKTVTATTDVGNRAPVADAGPDVLASPGLVFNLDGSGSTDPDGDSLTYAWTFVSIPDGSTAELTNPNTATPSFTPDLIGNYLLELTVSDGALTSTDRKYVSATRGSG